MQLEPSNANPIIFTSEQVVQARTIITKAIGDRVEHPDKFDFIPIIIENVIAVANKWFPILRTKSNYYQATLPQISGSYIDQEILTKVFDKIFKITLTCTTNYYGIAIHESILIPNGLKWHGIISHYPINVTCSWYLGNPYLDPRPQKDTTIPKQLAAALYKEEALKLKTMPSDFTIKVCHNDRETTFEAHRFKLACHSDIFLRLANNTFKETGSGLFTIHDHSPETVKLMLDYIYSGELDASLSLEQLIAVTHLANAYQAFSLVMACEQQLSTHLEAQFDEVYRVAAELNLKDLFPLCLAEIGQDAKRIQAFVDSIRIENFASLYQAATDQSHTKLLHKLNQWKKYNNNAKNFQISIEPATTPEESAIAKKD